MSDIRLGVIAGKPNRIGGLGNLSPIWKAPLQLDTGALAANCWIKLVSLPELVLECFCHLLAREMTLPSLAPIVVSDPQGLVAPPGRLLFGTQDAQSPSLRQLVATYPGLQALYISALQAWADSATLAVFDELMANGDRNMGNLLFNGRASWVPIDYSRSKAVGPHPLPSWDGTEQRLDHGQANHLIDVFRTTDAGNVHQALNRVERARLFVGVLDQFAGIPINGAEELAQKLACWIQDRRNWALRRLLGNRLSAIHGAAFAL
jgi:hypothetical protein